MSDLSSEELEQMQDESLALIGAWMDRGVSPTASAMILAAVITRVLVEMKVVTLSDLLDTITDGWNKCNGKL